MRVRRPNERHALDLLDVLSAVAEARRTRLELVCWRLDVDDQQARPAWAAALQHRLIEPVGSDVHTGETMFALSEGGRRVLEQRRPPRRRR